MNNKLFSVIDVYDDEECSCEHTIEIFNDKEIANGFKNFYELNYPFMSKYTKIEVREININLSVEQYKKKYLDKWEI